MLGGSQRLDVTIGGAVALIVSVVVGCEILRGARSDEEGSGSLARREGVTESDIGCSLNCEGEIGAVGAAGSDRDIGARRARLKSFRPLCEVPCCWYPQSETIGLVDWATRGRLNLQRCGADRTRPECRPLSPG